MCEFQSVIGREGGKRRREEVYLAVAGKDLQNGEKGECRNAAKLNKFQAGGRLEKKRGTILIDGVVKVGKPAKYRNTSGSKKR